MRDIALALKNCNDSSRPRTSPVFALLKSFLSPRVRLSTRHAVLLSQEADRQCPTDSGDSAGRKRCTTDRSSDARPNRSRLTRCGVCRDRLTDFPLVTAGIEEKENAVPVVFIDRFGQDFEFLATHKVVDACQVVDLQNQRDA